MTTSKLSRLGLGLALVAVLGLSAARPAPEASGDVVTFASATHSVQVQYVDSRGLWRRAKVTIKPIRPRATAPWRGQLQAVHVSGLRPASKSDLARFQRAGFPQTIRVNTGRSTNILMPAPENLKRIWFRGERGSIASRRIWTEYHNPSTYADDDGGDKPTDPEPEPDPEPDPDDPDPGDDDDCGPIPAGCEVYNPWTCECDIGLEDPWGDELQTEGSGFTFNF